MQRLTWSGILQTLMPTRSMSARGVVGDPSTPKLSAVRESGRSSQVSPRLAETWPGYVPAFPPGTSRANALLAPNLIKGLGVSFRGSSFRVRQR